MAHLYSDFDTAYAQECTYWLQARQAWVRYNSELDDAEMGWIIENYGYAIEHLIIAGREMGWVLRSALDLSVTECDQSSFMESFYWAGRPADGNGFDMDILLSTMVGADHHQLEYFIGLVDAYRQSLWNKPFNEEFFAALARGFAE